MPSNLLTPLAPCALIVLLTLPACHAQQARPQQARPEERDNSSRQENNSQPEIQHTNRLAEESSPYLLQHAHNPVDWYPWGEEAMRKAAQENKLIFLSVGYAACHWCHVMERESFTDEEIAAFMNEHFVCVKVDREERPDVDQIYMTSVQLISGQGGWPMSVFILPDGRPFWGGTYFPPRDGERGVSTGFLSILKQINQVWETQRDQVLQQADTLTEAIKATQPPQPEEIEGDLLSPEWVASTMQALQQQFDSTYGGFGTGLNQPKFPEPSNLVFLLQRAADSGLPEEQRQRAASMLAKSLDGMISGAMYDHLGGGFHRYSVDGGWQIPHFEKMLYDNAQLASVYVRAFEQTQRQEYRAIAEGICDFTIHQLQAESGGFYCALDADSEGEEGKFYRWTAQELDSLSEKPGIALAREVYRLKGKPNFEQHYYVPSPGDTLTDVARSRGETFSSLQERLAEPRATMLEVRSRREPPRTDVKILTAWNGLMIAALADVGRILQRDDYLEAAMNAAEFVERELRDSDGRLKRSYAAGEARLNGYVDDYAFYASGLLALHRATGEPRWFKLAQEVTRKQIDLFWDSQAGGFFFTSHDHPRLVVRVKDPVDGAVPAGSSVTLENLSALAEASRDDSYDEIRERTLKSLVPLWRRAANAAPRAAAQLHVYLEETRQP